MTQQQCSINQLDVTSDMVKSVLVDLDTKKAVGPDLVHNKLLRLSADIIAEPLAILFNRSLSEGIFPAIWKRAHVTPIFKKGEKGKCTNYRPVSLLSCVGKIMEKCVQKHVLEYLLDNNLLTSSQSGFIPGDSTVYQLLVIYNDFCNSLDNQTITGQYPDSCHWFRNVGLWRQARSRSQSRRGRTACVASSH